MREGREGGVGGGVGCSSSLLHQQGGQAGRLIEGLTGGGVS